MGFKRELWERQFPIYIKGGDAYKRKRVTKRQLVAKYIEKGGLMSPKINTTVQEGADDVTLEISYQITNVEEVTTEVQQLSGIRVSLMSPKGDEGTVVLWQRKVTGTGSKLGVFITVLGDDTDRWLGKWVVFKAWSPRNRQLELLSEKDSKSLKIPKK